MSNRPFSPTCTGDWSTSRCRLRWCVSRCLAHRKVVCLLNIGRRGGRILEIHAALRRCTIDASSDSSVLVHYIINLRNKRRKSFRSSTQSGSAINNSLYLAFATFREAHETSRTVCIRKFVVNLPRRPLRTKTDTQSSCIKLWRD